MTRDKTIFIKNIYYMLSYTFTTLRESGYKDIKKEKFDNVYNLFAAILAKGIAFLLKKGLYREYINKNEDIPVVRGKIDMPGTILNLMEQKMRITCDYDELSENNLLNQILKSTSFLLISEKKVDDSHKADLKKAMTFFSEVDLIDLRQVHWSSIRFQRNNQTYRMLLAICQLITEGCILTTESGEYHLASFVDDQQMSHLYEKFILEYYAQEYGEKIHGFSSKALQINWALDEGSQTELLPQMQTDITLTYGKKIIIIDAKYYAHLLQKRFDVQSLHSANVYQIFTYVKNKTVQCPDQQVAGMLLYADTDEQIDINHVYQMSGNQISVRTLDLNQEFSIIAGQLNGIVHDYFGIDYPSR